MIVVCDKALQSLGCSHVLEAYLQGLTVDGFTSVDSVREIQYEAAYQNCKWDLELVTRYQPLSLPFSYYIFLIHICIFNLLWYLYFAADAAGAI